MKTDFQHPKLSDRTHLCEILVGSDQMLLREPSCILGDNLPDVSDKGLPVGRLSEASIRKLKKNRYEISVRGEDNVQYYWL